jgi:MinD-like ATPase involved in chromosome partitioning or flagellar assembly
MTLTADTATIAVSDIELRFDAKGGPLVAVVGLCGGAGVSTLTYLVGLVAARASTAPILACDMGGPTAGLAAYAGVESPRSVSQIAHALGAREQTPGSLFAYAAEGLRLIAGGPQFTVPESQAGVARVLSDAAEAHGLTVVDCGTLSRPAEQLALGRATHVLWVLPATPSGAQRAARVLESVLPHLPGREVLVARHDAAARHAPMPDLEALADERRAPLVLMPHVPDLTERPVASVIEAAQVTLGAIATVIRA